MESDAQEMYFSCISPGSVLLFFKAFYCLNMQYFVYVVFYKFWLCWTYEEPKVSLDYRKHVIWH